MRSSSGPSPYESANVSPTKPIQIVDPVFGRLPHDLTVAIQDVYEPAGMKITSTPVREIESAEYGACRFGLDGQAIVFRVAKTTPTKIGQFVTVWKRPTPSAEIIPLDSADGIAFLVVNVSDATHHGQFVFDQKLLLEKGIMSKSGKGGKLAFRIYPPWSKPIVKEAIRTQKWQLQHFFPIAEDMGTDAVRVRKLFKPEAPDVLRQGHLF